MRSSIASRAPSSIRKTAGGAGPGAGATAAEAAPGGGAPRAVAINRVRWDETLSEQAQAAGAELVRARLVNVERSPSTGSGRTGGRDSGMTGVVRLHTQTDGRDASFTARVVVGADGAHSRVARSLGMAGPSAEAG